jgi:hypothetical protein
VDVSNLNRQLLFRARDAGFSAGHARNKAECAATLLPWAEASPHWYGEDQEAVDADYDVILALANERGARAALAARQQTVLMHATTSRSWQAQLHRHVAGHDDCIVCRLPPDAPALACSTQEVRMEDARRTDAAVPPLSAMAGLLLAVELARLQLGNLLDSRHNYTAVELSNSRPVTQRFVRRCTAGCATRHELSVRQAIDASSRWRDLDGGLGG